MDRVKWVEYRVSSPQHFRLSESAAHGICGTERVFFSIIKSDTRPGLVNQLERTCYCFWYAQRSTVEVSNIGKK